MFSVFGNRSVRVPSNCHLSLQPNTLTKEEASTIETVLRSLIKATNRVLDDRTIYYHVGTTHYLRSRTGKRPHPINCAQPLPTRSYSIHVANIYHLHSSIDSWLDSLPPAISR